jgi:poly(hydroxyalkanoate) granule-associated protein
MAKNLPKTPADQHREALLPHAVRDSAQQIWLAGLGAFSKAQEQGSKAFEALLQEGLNLQRRTQAAAEEKIAQTSSRVNAIANDMQAQATHRPDKLETIFEDRVAKALGRLGTPSGTQMNALLARLEQLEERIAQMSLASSATEEKPPASPAPGTKPAIAKNTRPINPPVQKPAAGKRAKAPKPS